MTDKQALKAYINEYLKEREAAIMAQAVELANASIISTLEALAGAFHISFKPSYLCALICCANLNNANKTKSQKLAEIKKITGRDKSKSIKTLQQGRYIDDNLNLTSKGIDAISAFYLAYNSKIFVKQGKKFHVSPNMHFVTHRSIDLFYIIAEQQRKELLKNLQL
jgi:hypothetical protein